MYIQVRNNSYGYSVTTYDKYVAVGNPNFFEYDDVFIKSGSIDVYKYNVSTNQHDLVNTLYLPFDKYAQILAREMESDLSIRDSLKTEISILTNYSDNKIQIDSGEYLKYIENWLGCSLDLYKKILVAGVPHYKLRFKTDSYEYVISGSLVCVYDVTSTNNPYPFLTIDNPEPSVTQSFGVSVSLNEDWMAIGSPYSGSFFGKVYIYKKTGNSWNLFQEIVSPSASAGEKFGYGIELNKKSGSYNSLVVGCGGITNHKAYYFELVNNTWTCLYVFEPDYSVYPLTFNSNIYPHNPQISGDGFGYSVSIYGDTVVIGSYSDRLIYEYPSSEAYQQGSVYIFEKCPPESDQLKFHLLLKTYGDKNILKNNRLGYSVDIFGDHIVAGSPTPISFVLDPCLVKNTLYKTFYCNDPDTFKPENFNGQAVLLKRGEDGNWSIVNTYQNKKKYLSPFRSYGYDVSLGSFSMVIGSPLMLSGDYRVEIDRVQEKNIDLDDISGKAYIYNFNNLRKEFHVGNVFYRNGLIVLITSGSNFDGLILDKNDPRINYRYSLSYESLWDIYERQYICTVAPGEFNVSTNPTAYYFDISVLDINKNGKFDFIDLYCCLSVICKMVYDFYDWGNVLKFDEDEKSYYKYLCEKNGIPTVEYIESIFNEISSSENYWKDIFDINDDDRLDINDMYLLWKYFSNRLSENNIDKYVTIYSKRRDYSSLLSYLDYISLKNQRGKILSPFTASLISPYVTTVGLYSGLELVAIAKLSNPTKLSKKLPTNFIIKIDF